MRRRLLFKLLSNCTVPRETLMLLTELVFSPPLSPSSFICHHCNYKPRCNLLQSLLELCFLLTPSSLPPSPCLLASVRLLYLWAITVIHCCGTNHLHTGVPPISPASLSSIFAPCLSPIFPQLWLSALPNSWSLLHCSAQAKLNQSQDGSAAGEASKRRKTIKERSKSQSGRLRKK